MNKIKDIFRSATPKVKAYCDYISSLSKANRKIKQEDFANIHATVKISREIASGLETEVLNNCKHVPDSASRDIQTCKQCGAIRLAKPNLDIYGFPTPDDQWEAWKF